MRTLAALSLALMAGCTSASADGCNPRVQDCSALEYGAKPAAYRPAMPKTIYRYTPSHFRRSPKGGSVCGDNIPARQCSEFLSRFKDGLKKENARRARATVRSDRRIREARDEYRDERGRKVIILDDRSPRRDRYREESRREPRNRCLDRVTIKSSKPMWTAGSACAIAKAQWSDSVAAAAGAEYSSVARARDIDADASPMHAGAIRKVCTFSAIPCRKSERDRYED